MTPDQETLLRRLEQATANELADDEALDSESAALRETWLAFGSLLKAAEQHAPTARTPVYSPANVPRRWKLDSWPLWLAGTGIAVAVLAMFGVWWIGGESSNRVVKDFAPREFPAVVAEPAKPTVPSEEHSGPSADIGDLAWEDEWDSSLLQAERVLAQFSSRADREATWRDLHGRVDALAREIELEQM